MGRRDRNIAKTEIYNVFRERVLAGDAKITVSAIAEAAGVSRKTFYNHFVDQDALVAWGYRHDMLQALLVRFDRDDLIDPPYDPYGFEDVPFYVRIPSNALSLDQSEYFYAFYDMLFDNKAYYKALLRSEFAPALKRYLVQVYEGLFYDDVKYFLNGRKMPEREMRLIAIFNAEAVANNMLDMFLNDGPIDPAVFGKRGPIDNMAHECMLHLVEAYQTEKSNLYFRSRGLR